MLGAPLAHPFGDLVRRSIFMLIYVDFMLILVALWLPFGTPLAPPGSIGSHLAPFWLPFGTLWAPCGWFWLPFGSILSDLVTFLLASG